MASSGLTMMLGPKLDVQSLNTKSFWTWFYRFFFPVHIETKAELSQALGAMLQQWPGEANAAFAERKQLWSVGVATVLLEQILFFWSGDTFKRRLLDLQIKNVVRA